MSLASNLGFFRTFGEKRQKQRKTRTLLHQRAREEEHRAATSAKSVSAYRNLLEMGSITKCDEERATS
jgi:hypothetical protein